MQSSEAKRRLIYRGTKLDLALQSVATRDGGSIDREVVIHRGAVALLVYVDADHLCLVRNVRYAVGETLLEVPAGTIDEGESPAETAARELKEETGYTAASIKPAGSWWVSPGILNERMYLFECTDLTPGESALAPDERLEPVIVPWHVALAMIADGRIQDAKSMLAILLTAKRRESSA